MFSLFEYHTPKSLEISPHTDEFVFCIWLHIYPLITKKRSKRYNELAYELPAICLPHQGRGNQSITESIGESILWLIDWLNPAKCLS